MSNLTELIGGGGSAKVWVSGEVTPQYAYRISPADKETYQKLTTSGASATDPADDTTNWRAASYDRVVSIYASSAQFVSGSLTYANSSLGAVKATATISVGVRTLILDIAGRGFLTHLSDYQGDTSSKQLRVELLIDGRSLYDTTMPATSGALQQPHIGGLYQTGTPTSIALDAIPIHFRRSLRVYVTPITRPWTSGSSAICYRIGSTA